jgi:dTDP-4-dehydrorhamnose reductase
VRAVKPTLIVNPAAYTAVDLAENDSDLAMRINAEAPKVMAEEALVLGAALIHYSTDYVFDGEKIGPYVEDDTPNPQNVYGRSKLAGEQAIQASGVSHLILRTSWVYGMRGKNFLRTVQRLAQERDELRIVADQIGAPTWCRTIADTTAHIVSQLQARSGKNARNVIDEDVWRAHSSLYHLTAQGQTSWHGFTQAIVAHASTTKKPHVVPIATKDYPLPAKRPQNSTLSCERFINTFCDLPRWDEALKLCLD